MEEFDDYGEEAGKCEECGSRAVLHEGGCSVCRKCGEGRCAA